MKPPAPDSIRTQRGPGRRPAPGGGPGGFLALKHREQSTPAAPRGAPARTGYPVRQAG